MKFHLQNLKSVLYYYTQNKSNKRCEKGSRQKDYRLKERTRHGLKARSSRFFAELSLWSGAAERFQ